MGKDLNERKTTIMRLGACYSANTFDELEPLCEKLDAHGLSAVGAPERFWEWSDDECIRFGEKARSLDIHIGEIGFWENLLDTDADAVTRRIETIRMILRKADKMGVNCVMTLVGSRDIEHGALSPHPFNFTVEAKKQFREVCLRIVDGLELNHTLYAIEPWNNTFFQDPRLIREFLDAVDDPRVKLHLDQTNLITQQTYYHTTDLVNLTFDLLAPDVASVHAKDLYWVPGYFFLKFDEVSVGDGVMDYETFLKRIDRDLPPDMTVFTEHWRTDEEYVTAIGRLHTAADQAGVRFLRRNDGHPVTHPIGQNKTQRGD